MANEPVQVVLNPGALRAPRDRPTPNGNGRDFFAGRNNAFQEHQERLAGSIAAISTVLESARGEEDFGGLGYVKVRMAPNAIAKSHRAQKRLFQPAWTPHVGTDGIGEPIYAVTPTSLRKVLAETLRAESDVPLKLDPQTGQMKPNPSRNRCEVSAIESIHLWTEQDKRDFSAAEASVWLARVGTGGRYLVELFPLATADRDAGLARAEQVSLKSLQDELSTLSVDARALRGLGQAGALALSVRVNKAGTPSYIELEPPILLDVVGQVDAPSSLVSTIASEHQDVLRALERSPLVRSVVLPPVVQREELASAQLSHDAPAEIFERKATATPARVGVIDGGVAGPIAGWVEARWGQIAEADRDSSHGTFISGLLVAAGQLNTYLQKQTHGCLIYDVDVLPADPGGTGAAFASYYPDGIPDFMDEVEVAVRDFRENHGVRIFNLSMNFTSPGDSSRYGYSAARLDEIAARHDVIFVISAGNVEGSAQRIEWREEPDLALASLANDSVSILSEPGESLYNASVSALNPPGLPGQVPFALARYSRRGPGLRGATKPDFAHVGGSGTSAGALGSGLFSVDERGQVVSGAGTSYSAPLVARRLADLDALIEGDVSRETLLALLVHHARTPC